MKDPASASWHLDKRVPIALIVAILAQSAAAIWWASGVSAYMANAGLAQTALGVRVDRLEQGRDDLNQRMTRVETLLGTVSDQVQHQGPLLEQILAELRTGKNARGFPP